MSLPQSTTGRIYSRGEYRRWCDAQPRGRFERVDGVIVAMAPERGAHLRVKGNVYSALKRAIVAAGVDCQALPDGATVETGDSDYEPDATVNSGAPMSDDDIAAPNPVVVVEVLSPGTKAVDTGGKFVGYFQVKSISHYLIVHPTQRLVTHHRRVDDMIVTTIPSAGPIELSPPGLIVTVEECYEKP